MVSVGSFIWSHLHNLLKSSIPSRVEIQGLLSDKELVKKFSNDARKFSNNYEGSIFFDEYNVGKFPPLEDFLFNNQKKKRSSYKVSTTT